MHWKIRAALAAAAAICFAASTAAAQAPAPPPTQGDAPAPAVPADAQAPAAPPESPAPAAGPPALPQTPPAAGEVSLIAYVKHTKAPVLIDSTPGKAAFALIGTVAMISAGHDIVVADDIQDPSGDMAHEIAAAYAAVHGGRVADAPLLDDHLLTRAKTSSLAEESNGARYVVDADPPGLNLIYFPLDWAHFDLMFSGAVRIIDTSNDKIVLRANCFMKPHNSPEAMGHGELLADHGAALKLLIAKKSQACIDKMKADLKL